MRCAAIIGIISLGLSIPIPASSQQVPTGLRAKWLALGDPSPSKVLILQEGKAQPYVQIVPSNAYRLSNDALSEKGGRLIPVGALLARVDGHDDTWCEISRQKRHERFVCLLDSDHDGKADSYSMLWVNSDIFMWGQGNSKAKPLQSTVELLPVDVRTEVPRLTVEVFFYNRAEIPQRNDIQFCTRNIQNSTFWGSAVRLCTAQTIYLKDVDYPSAVPLYGGTVRFASRENNTISLELDYPDQDFEF